ncbi:SDR family NAD(P)-dependent oxidoreductase [Pararhizobium antarcticum]|uniref:3-oxoacyl-ACP reductase n=1 Tax=Pararhizobium antarcticum TaxID=1798805 RepID=A0A657LYU2_9HYPH|nr:SDR family oxidoreductase [Pararhizobium antarcticum]OJF90402.1 3-oxoacyl-ACP reductase [Rhizobium sp. 58]OJG00536.1 3-oxoacyl-ACP reductase [Pararhizobium antarcticum]
MAMPSARFPDLKDRAVLITGGSSGIGAALVEGFLAQGSRVAFIDIDRTAGEALVERLADNDTGAPVFIKADLRDIDAMRLAVEQAVAAIGPIGVLINNAARDDRNLLEEVTPETWDESQAVNLRPHFFMAQAVAPSMRSLGHGSIINFSSIAFMLNVGDLPVYSAAKAGIIGLTKSLAGHLGPENIRVNAVLPGMVVTQRQKDLWLTDGSIKAMIEKQCLKRTLLAEDLVGPCLYLASDCSQGMTAQTMIVDGGVF